MSLTPLIRPKNEKDAESLVQVEIRIDFASKSWDQNHIPDKCKYVVLASSVAK